MKSDAPVLKVVFGLAICFSLGAVGCLLAALIVSRQVDDTMCWAATRGVVLDASVEARSVRRHTAFYPSVHYRYEVAGRMLEGRRVTFLEDSISFAGTEAVRAALRGFERGAEVPVYYDPARPQDSTLRRGRPNAASELLPIGLALLVPAAIFAFFSYTMWSNSPQRRGATS